MRMHGTLFGQPRTAPMAHSPPFTLRPTKQIELASWDIMRRDGTRTCGLRSERNWQKPRLASQSR